MITSGLFATIAQKSLDHICFEIPSPHSDSRPGLFFDHTLTLPFIILYGPIYSVSNPERVSSISKGIMDECTVYLVCLVRLGYPFPDRLMTDDCDDLTWQKKATCSGIVRHEYAR